MNTQKQFKLKINELLVTTLKHYIRQHEATMTADDFTEWYKHNYSSDEYRSTFSTLEKILLEEKMLLPKTIKFTKQNKRDFEKDDKDRGKALEKLHVKWKKELIKMGTSSFSC
jgi:hypothetical protein